MDLSKTKLYQAINDPSMSAVELWRACQLYITSKKNVNIMDSSTGQTFMHVLAGHGGHVLNPSGVAVIYLMAGHGLNLDARDNVGDTCLHKAMRVPDSYRMVEALMRCGVDPLIRNTAGLTAEEVLMKEMPREWRHTAHWYRKYHPGLYHAISGGHKEQVTNLLKGWCRVRTTRPDGEEVSLERLVPTTDEIRALLQKYEATNEFVISMLGGRPFDLNDPMLADVNKDTLDHMNEAEGQPVHKPRVVPKPLILATWECHQEASVDTLLSIGANTSTLFSRTGIRTEAEPLFFHLLTSDQRPPDTIIHKVLRHSDMSARNQEGQTVLFKAITHDFSSQFVKALFKYGVDVAARDNKGRTARDLAESLRKSRYFTEIDEHLIEIVKDCNLERLHYIVLQGYDHILDITDNRGINITKMLHLHYTLNPNKEDMLIFMEKIRVIQHHICLMLRATDTGGTDELKSYASRKFASAQDKCGRSILHKAIVNKKKDLIKFVVQNYRHIIDMQDNLGRVALHYAYLVTEGTSLVNYLLLHGANPHIPDWAGRLPEAYHVESCGKDEYIRLQRAVNSFTMDVYLAETNFQHSLDKCIKRGDLAGVEELVLGLTDKGDINRYATILFDCVDTGRQRIAVYLIRQGMRTDIYKQYETCSSRSSACSTYTCDHTLTSLFARARHVGCHEVLKAINEMSAEKDAEVDGRPSIKGPSTLDQFSLLGMV
ncbi:uncharacterized protein LOC127879738 isoform X1 [Dreissena polymorpha]|nr:uncharacterized protein LOC127879738 isoform X1 [Dreissena polymorpha]